MVRGADHREHRLLAGFVAWPKRRSAALLVLAAVLCGVGVAPAPAQDDPAEDLPLTDRSSVKGPAGVRADDPVYIPDVSRWLPKATSRESLGSSLQIVVLLTLLTVAPSVILMMTCFSRMLIVLVLLRQALGTQSLPPSQVLVGLALFMTALVMAPTWQRIRDQALDPYLDGKMAQLDALTIAGGELRSFMFTQIEAAGNEADVYMLYEYAVRQPLAPSAVLDRDAVPMTALIPAFILSELKAAFVLGFRIYLPFLVIDMVIATVLVSMGMMMLPPVLISLPFKLLLFVLADGWHLVAGSLMASVV